MSAKKQIRDLLKREIKQELQRRKRTWQNGNGSPLWSWIRGTNPNEPSRIHAVCGNRSRYCFGTFREAVEEAARRLSNKYRLTSVQHYLLLMFLARRSRARIRDSVVFLGLFDDQIYKNRSDRMALEIIDLIYGQMKILRADELPLRVILSTEFTTIILAEQLKGILK